MRIRKASVAAGIFALIVSTVGHAETIRLPPVDDGIAADDSPFDGKPDRLFDTLGDRVAFLPGVGDQRAVMHFDINSVKGLRVLRATLRLDMVNRSIPESTTIFPIEVRGYNSIGVLRLNDFQRGTFVAVVDGVAASITVPVSINVTERVKSVLASPSGMIGFTLRTNMEGIVAFGSLEDGPAAAPLLVIVTK